MNTSRRIKTAIVDRLKAWPAFSGIPIYTDFEENLPGKIDAAMKEAEEATEKRGAFCVVTVPTTKDFLPNVQLGPNQHFLAVFFYEELYLNLSANGFGITGDDFLTNAKDLLKTVMIEGLCWIHSPQKVYSPAAFDPLVGRRISQLVLLADERNTDSPSEKVTKPEIVINAGVATITGAVGASVYYSLSDAIDVPTALNGGVLYGAPVSITTGQTIKACAYISGQIPSDVASKTA